MLMKIDLFFFFLSFPSILKSLVIKPEEKKKYTTGEIVNLMSVDSSNINNATAYLWIIWSAPLQICIALYLLYITLGYAIFTGVGILILMLPLNGIVTKKLASYQRQQMTIKDTRIKLTNEILNGIKVRYFIQNKILPVG